MTADLYNDITNAGHVLCQYCEAHECNNRMVTHLLDDAYIEAVNAGIIENYENEDEGDEDDG